MALLDVRDLSRRLRSAAASEPSTAVDGVRFSVDAGQVVGLVGESGCGKCVTSLAIMGLLPKRRGIKVGGEVASTAPTCSSCARSDLRDLRGRDIAMIFQDPLSSLNPVIPIGLQVTEVLARHRGMKGKAAPQEAAELLDRVGIPDPKRRLKEYPHQLSGGMRQRALIAMAVACQPRLLIADEPTTALDVTIQAQILELLKDLVHDSGTALVMITHDLGVVAGLCDTVNVLYARPGGRAGRRRDAVRASRGTRTRSGCSARCPRLDAAARRAAAPDPRLGPRRAALAGGLRVRAALRPRGSTTCVGEPPCRCERRPRSRGRPGAAAVHDPWPHRRRADRGRRAMSSRRMSLRRGARPQGALPDQAAGVLFDRMVGHV